MAHGKSKARSGDGETGRGGAARSGGLQTGRLQTGRPQAGRPRNAPARRAARAPRQDRGERRVADILDAAEEVIAQVGVEAATTNAIAARARAGMGSLYHFFPDKEAIVEALAQRYQERMRPITEYRGRPELARVSLARMVDLIVDPLVAFFRRSPAYPHVFHAAIRSGARSASACEMQESIVRHVEAIVSARAPGVSRRRRRAFALIEVELVHALLTFAFASPVGLRPALIKEVKRLVALHAEMLEKGDDPLTRLR